MKRVYYILLFFACCWGSVSAQGLHFSQYFNAPLLVNPANTGFNPDYDYRIGGNYRSQWANLIANPYQTMNLWGDIQLFNGKFTDSWVGVGGSIYKDQAGSAGLSTTQAYASVAYHQMLGNASLLSLGVNVGTVNYRVDGSKLIFDNWDGQNFNSSGNSFINASTNYLDLQVGLNYAWFISDMAYLNVGFSAMHLNKPTQSFLTTNSQSAQTSQTVPIRSTFFVNTNFKIEDLWILNPNIYVSQSTGRTEVVMGMNANRNLSGDGVTQLLAGMYYRVNDAIIPMVGYQVNDLKITVSYDVTSSGLAGFNNAQGGYEASIIKSGAFSATHAIKCPVMKF